VGDFAINLHDTFNLSQDTSQDPTVSGIADIFRLENTAGITVLWDLYKVVLEANYDHYNYSPLDNFYSYLTHQSELGSFRASALVTPSLTLGMELGGGLTSYRDAALSDNQNVSIGPFTKWKLSEAMDLRASAGYLTYWFDASTYITNSTTLNSYYADVTLNHQPTLRTRQSLSLGQSVSTDLNGAPIQLFYVRYAVSLNIIRNWTLRPNFTFETGDERRGLVQENLTRYGGGISLGRQITRKLSGSLSYYLLVKQSNVPNYDYTQNRLVLNLIYQF
jgi:hypothetical protein